MKTLVAVNNCLKYLNRRSDCERTWVQLARDKGLDCRYVYLSDSDSETEADLNFSGHESYTDLSYKFYRTIQFALDYDFEYLFKCDDDTYVDIKQLQKDVAQKKDSPFYKAIKCSEAKIGHAFGGNGHLINRSAMEKIIDIFGDRELTKKCPVDDYLMAYALKSQNITFNVFSQYETYTWHYVYRQGYDLLHQQIVYGQKIVPDKVLYDPRVVTRFWQICEFAPDLNRFQIKPENMGEGIDNQKQRIWRDGMSVIDNLEK